ncbi:MAG: GxxExxY protein [bacterium]|nr:GxxExxY protein [bacterium]
MNADQRGLKELELTERIIGVFFDVYNELGVGFLESVYEASMEIALNDAGLQVTRQVPIPVWFRERQVGEFRADLLVEQAVILELKAVRVLESIHKAQLLNYLRATLIEVGLLLNFGRKPEFKRFVFDNARKSIRENPCSSAAESTRQLKGRVGVTVEQEEKSRE